MKNNLVKWIRIFLLIILSIINIGILIFSIYFIIISIFFIFIGVLYGLLEYMSSRTFNIYILCIIFNIILEIYLTISLIRSLIKYKEKGNISSFFFIMLLFATNVTSTVLITKTGLITTNIQTFHILTIFYIIYFIVK